MSISDEAILFSDYTLEQQAQALANFLPNGELFLAKNVNDSIYRMFLRGLAHVGMDAQSYLRLFDREVDITRTVELLEEWEATVGIPDDCFDTNTTIEIRRQQVLIKLAALGVQTEQDFKDLALLFGIVIEIDSGIKFNTFTLTLPVIFFETAKAARFTMVVTYFVQQTSRFPYTFDFVFGDGTIPIIECLFRKLVPANVDLFFLQDLEETDITTRSWSDGFSDGFG